MRGLDESVGNYLRAVGTRVCHDCDRVVLGVISAVTDQSGKKPKRSSPMFVHQIRSNPLIPDQLILEVSPHLRVIAQIGGEVVDAHLDRYHSGAVVADGGGRVQVRAL